MNHVGVLRSREEMLPHRGNQARRQLVVSDMRSWTSVAVLVLITAAFTGSGCSNDGSGATPTSATPTSATPTDETSPEPATGVPTRDPDVRGVVSLRPWTSEGVEEAVLGEPSDPYYELMLLRRGDPVVVDGETGKTLDIADLDDGAEVEVWITGGCAESFPVQCEVVALRVSDSK